MVLSKTHVSGVGRALCVMSGTSVDRSVDAFDEICTHLSAALEADGSRLSADYDREMGEWWLTRGDGERFYLGRNYDDEVILSC
jgi:hypothetical protein